MTSLDIDMKTCSTCGVTLDISFFNKSPAHKDGYHGVCKPCKNAARRGKRTETPEQNRDYNLKSKYGLYQCDVDEILEFQKHCCAVCDVHETEAEMGKLFVDHCHDTGEVRGMLCHHCNIMLGSARDVVSTLQAGINYLQETGY